MSEIGARGSTATGSGANGKCAFVAPLELPELIVAP